MIDSSYRMGFIEGFIKEAISKKEQTERNKVLKMEAMGGGVNPKMKQAATLPKGPIPESKPSKFTLAGKPISKAVPKAVVKPTPKVVPKRKPNPIKPTPVPKTPVQKSEEVEAPVKKPKNKSGKFEPGFHHSVIRTLGGQAGETYADQLYALQKKRFKKGKPSGLIDTAAKAWKKTRKVDPQATASLRNRMIGTAIAAPFAYKGLKHVYHWATDDEDEKNRRRY